MRAMILAAGRGTRMQHLTQDSPKALLKAGKHFLIEYPIYSLIKAGIKEIVINVCYQAEKIKEALGDGAKYGVNIIYSEEEEALETGGGIVKALPLLGEDPFMVLSCDVITDFSLKSLPRSPKYLAHLVLVNNPTFHLKGDFGLSENKVLLSAEKTFTFANIGVYHPDLFKDCKESKFRLGDLIKQAIQNDQVTGEFYSGFWENLGTPSQLEIALPENLF